MDNKKKKGSVWKWIIGIVVVFVIIGAIGGGSSKTNTSGSNTASEKPTAAPTPIVIDATALIKEYDTNKLAAEEKYTKKVVQTSGIIKNISKDITSNYFLSLNPNNDQYYFGTTIACYFKGDSQKSALLKLINGQEVGVKGEMGDMSLGLVVMNNCQIVR